MLRYGILSTSSIAPRFIAGVREAQAGEILALSSRSLEKAREKAAQWDIPRAYGSHDQLLADGEVDIVYISTVNAAHFTWARKALLAGKHVVCEKPCTTSVAETQALFDLARERGLFFMEAQKMLFLPAVLALEEKIREGALGQVYMAQLSHSFPGSYNGWMFDKAAGGGPLLSSGIYAVELMTWLFGPISDLTIHKSTLPTGVEWQYILTGQAGEVLFSAKNSTRAVMDNTCRIYGTRGWAELPLYWKAQKVVFHLEDGEQTLAFPQTLELSYEAAHIARCIREGRITSPVVTPELTLAGIRAITSL